LEKNGGKTAMGELSAIPIWLCIPFAGLLLSIAVMPLFKPDWQLHSGQSCLLFLLQRNMEYLQ
jgi:hypothetical protein